MIDKIPFTGLLNEMRDYSPVTFRTDKAKTVWMKCIDAGKFNLASLIENKWGKPKQYDIVMAFGLSLLEFNQQK